MENGAILPLEELSCDRLYSLFTESEKLLGVASRFREVMDQSYVRRQIVEVVEANYDLGKVVEVFEIFGGYINRSFGIYTEKDGQRSKYFVRKYKKEIKEKEIQFEHALIDFCIANGLDVAAAIIRNKEDPLCQ